MSGASARPQSPFPNPPAHGFLRMAKPENFLVACDIGSSKICVLIGEQNARGSLDVIGKGAAVNRGTRKGNIVNVDATIEAIKRAAEEAEIMAGVQISRAWVGVSGSNVRSFNSRGVVAVAGTRPGDHPGRRHAGRSTRRAGCRSLRTTRSCTSCRATSRWTARTASATRSAWWGRASRRTSTSSPRPSP